MKKQIIDIHNSVIQALTKISKDEHPEVVTLLSEAGRKLNDLFDRCKKQVEDFKVFEDRVLLEDYEDQDSPENIAHHRGLVVKYPEQNQLQIDIDRDGDAELFEHRVTLTLNEVGIAHTIERHPSNSGLPNEHITVTLDHEITSEWHRIALQFALGSDHAREFMNVLRLLRGDKRPVRFFEKPAECTCEREAYSGPICKHHFGADGRAVTEEDLQLLEDLDIDKDRPLT